MCGIAGYFSPSPIPEDRGRAILSAMAGALRHRGPDGEGFYLHPQCGLASTRLAIIDLEGGRMPMFNEDRSVAVTFNGEIYNHAELRSALVSKGHTFATRADTEVLVHGYEDAPEAFLASLTGMFAFALWDEKQRRLLLARDRFGIKPLFVAETGAGILLFASEAKAILRTGLVEPRLDRRALLDLFSSGYPMPPNSAFEGIRALSPASFRRLDAEGADETRFFWTMPYPEAGTAPRESRALAADPAKPLASLLDRAVADHLIADVTVGSYLSGGLDSITIATLAAKRTSGRLRTFSMGFSAADRVYDESDMAGRVAEALGADHRRIEIAGVSSEDYLGTIRAMEAPQVHTVAFCLYQLSRAVREAGLKVVLTGEGSDELFAGYGAFRLRRMRRVFGGWFRPIRDVLLRGLVAAAPKKSAIPRSLLRWSKLERHVAARYGLVPPWIEQWWLLLEEALALMTEEARARLGAALPIEDASLLPVPPDGAPSAETMLKRELRFEQQSRLDGWVLVLGDRLTMAHSVEARVPFLDHRVAEFSAEIPARELLRGFEEKRILRRAMQGTILEEARRRKKRAFMAPITRWLFESPRPVFVDDALSETALRKRRMFDPKAVQDRLSLLASGRKDLAALRASWALNLALGIELFLGEFKAVGP